MIAGSIVHRFPACIRNKLPSYNMEHVAARLFPSFEKKDDPLKGVLLQQSALRPHQGMNLQKKS
ncbi:uncharacterized protein METZ01_LOCUS499510 [marine metagenome]|uniref:Uncharacterized protein n=1 Tax=marine metagenome TaxID=408172 RepID=A0A383DQ79_9ZZZZ